MSETAAQRLNRLLALLPYISRRPGVSVTDLAAEFGVKPAQVMADLDLLMVCGLPGYYPDDLIDVVLDEDGGNVSIAFDAGIERPVRLTSDEAVALTSALRTLADLPGLVDSDAVDSALAKLSRLAEVTDPGVRVAAAESSPALTTVREALAGPRRLWMRYYTASRDAVSERTVDPMRLLVTDGHVYLEAWCHRAQGVRHFRVDRIDEAKVLDESAQSQLWVDEEIPEKVFHAGQLPTVTLRLAPAARWVAEYYPTESVTELEDGALRVVLRMGGDEWLVRLVLSLGDRVRIEDRPELAATVVERALSGLSAYGADGEPGANQ